MQEKENIRGDVRKTKKYGGVGLPMSSLGIYKDNLSNRERNRGGGHRMTKKWGDGYVSSENNGGMRPK